VKRKIIEEASEEASWFPCHQSIYTSHTLYLTGFILDCIHVSIARLATWLEATDKD
jgi:hypothetical protein